MKKNMGSADKMIRYIVAVAILILYMSGIITGTLGLILIVLAGIFVVTGVINFCPLYLPFGLNTRKDKNKTQK